MRPTIRVGIEGARPVILAEIRRRNTPVLVSANSLWNDRSRQWRQTWRAYADLDVALDSGGFVAMHRYGGFRWTAEQYAHLAAAMQPTWWAQMDYCCEPEIASSRSQVFERIDRTAQALHQCRQAAVMHGAQCPLIVLQGWHPSDYVSGPAFDDPSFVWPFLVGVGSVCRRALHGSSGLLAVIGAIDRALPDYVRLHFFGVKGASLSYLRDHPRFASMDSMAWSMAARWDALKRKRTCDAHWRAMHLRQWLDRQHQLSHSTQLQLPLCNKKSASDLTFP
jgi:hypothetical protein